MKLPDDVIQRCADLRRASEITWRIIGAFVEEQCMAAKAANEGKPRRQQIPLTAVEQALADALGVTRSTIHAYRFYTSRYGDVLDELMSPDGTPLVTFHQLRCAVAEANRTGESVDVVLIRRIDESLDGFAPPPPDRWGAELRYDRAEPKWWVYIQRATASLATAAKKAPLHQRAAILDLCQRVESYQYESESESESD
jgi:hypothetical protein